MIHAITTVIVAIIAIIFRKVVHERDIQLQSQVLVAETERVLRNEARK